MLEISCIWNLHQSLWASHLLSPQQPHSYIGWLISCLLWLGIALHSCHSSLAFGWAAQCPSWAHTWFTPNLYSLPLDLFILGHESWGWNEPRCWPIPRTGRHPASSWATSVHANEFLFWHICLIVHLPIINSYLLAVLQFPYYPPPAPLTHPEPESKVRIFTCVFM